MRGPQHRGVREVQEKKDERKINYKFIMCFKPFKGPSLISPYFKNEKKISNENFTKQKKKVCFSRDRLAQMGFTS